MNDVKTSRDDLVLTIVDALDCFWNAAMGAAHARGDFDSMSTATVVAEGVAAVSARLRESAAERQRHAPEAADRIEWLEDKVEGLTADLENAVEVAYRRGATEWTRLNYPDLFARLEAHSQWEIENNRRGGQVVWDEPHVTLLGQAAILAAAPPAPTREEVARIIDPVVGCDRSDVPGLRHEETLDEREADAYAKADAILSLLGRPVAAVLRAKEREG